MAVRNWFVGGWHRDRCCVTSPFDDDVWWRERDKLTEQDYADVEDPETYNDIHH